MSQGRHQKGLCEFKSVEVIGAGWMKELYMETFKLADD